MAETPHAGFERQLGAHMRTEWAPRALAGGAVKGCVGRGPPGAVAGRAGGGTPSPPRRAAPGPVPGSVGSEGRPREVSATRGSSTPGFPGHRPTPL